MDAAPGKLSKTVGGEIITLNREAATIPWLFYCWAPFSGSRRLTACQSERISRAASPFGSTSVTPLPVLAASRKTARARMCGRKRAPMASSAASDLLHMRASWGTGDTGSEEKQIPCPSVSVCGRSPRSPKCQMWQALLEQWRDRRTPWRRATLAISKDGVSRMTRLTWRLTRTSMPPAAWRTKPREPAELRSFRFALHRTSDFLGSMSRTTTRSPAACAATARQAASVLLPQPPFCVGKYDGTHG